jgi:DNA-binding transcriptional regulator YdaS (Cro superfamily)
MRLEEWKRARGLVDVEIARLVGASQAAVNRWLNGVRTPSPKMQRAIFVATDGWVTANDWLRLGPVLPPPPASADVKMSRRGRTRRAS